MNNTDELELIKNRVNPNSGRMRSDACPGTFANVIGALEHQVNLFVKVERNLMSMMGELEREIESLDKMGPDDHDNVDKEKAQLAEILGDIDQGIVTIRQELAAAEGEGSAIIAFQRLQEEIKSALSDLGK